MNKLYEEENIVYKNWKYLLCFTLSILLISATILPNLALATTQTKTGNEEREILAKVQNESLVLTDNLESDEYLNERVDDFMTEIKIFDVNFDDLTEEEAEAFFEEVINDEEYYYLENEINRYINELDRLEADSDEAPIMSTRALPIAFAAIGVVALRIAVTQGTKAATAYLKKAVKKYSTQYKITFPSSKQLILIQDKKTKKRLFSLDNHSVKLVHKTTGKGYAKAFSAWHFHKSPDMTQHYLMCSSIPKNYKVQKGKCYF